MVAPASKRRAAGHLVKTHGVSERRACRVLQLHRSVARYRSISQRDDGVLRERLQTLDSAALDKIERQASARNAE